MSGAVHPLTGDQKIAVDPRESVWLSASAGTGKTQVLSARVLRLLLEPGTDPAQILCLTFTKAGAAEMAVRVSEVLARWVRLPATDLGTELGHLGARIDPATQARARSLFARVLDCPGGGLRIDTIHAFAQYLLAAFPAEAEILPGARPMEDRERDLLSRDVLAALVEEGHPTVLAAVTALSRRKGPDAVIPWLMRCAKFGALWHGPGGWQPPMLPRLQSLLGMPVGTGREWAEEACSDALFPVDALLACSRANARWGTPTGLANADMAASWLAATPSRRLETLDDFYGKILTQKGEPSRLANLEKVDPAYGAHIDAVREGIALARERMALVELALYLAPLLEAGRLFAIAWEEAKAREGLVDFDDQIERAARLLADSDMAAWIRYKLDRSFDHILVDEAQDTNRAQWDIVEALIDDFFAGEGARGDRVRTIFTVGDFKQAIFGFQGTSPRNFSDARERVRERMRVAAEAAATARGAPERRPLRDAGLDRSYRTSTPVLDFVDAAITAIGPERMGLEDPYANHFGETRAGLVTLWHTVHADSAAENGEAEEGWLGKHDRKMADNIARQVREWLDTGFALEKHGRRAARPGDIMILVQKRRELAALIVARLYRHGVPVAGVDRLRLGNPLAVKDLMAALRFAAQPLDDLNLANLLVSPLIGWSQETLLEQGWRDAGVRLWDHLRDGRHPDVVSALADLREILRRADFDDPAALLRWILVGPLDGRRKLVARLGREANDPIDELLNAAAAFAAQHTASLHGFLRWFDAGDGEIKREAGGAADQVRVMTVHGSKGLQAPIVILADAAIGPDGASDLDLTEHGLTPQEARRVPLPALSRHERVGPIAAAEAEASAAALEEHWRLLYVAMTRAEEALFIGGSLGPRQVRSGPPEDSWYARLKPVFGDAAIADPIWGARWSWGAAPDPIVPDADVAVIDPIPVLPDWAQRRAADEPRPPRPLAPSGLGAQEGSDPPLPAATAAGAARRGTLIHALLERLPALPAAERAQAAHGWLARQAADLEDSAREEIAAHALAVLSDPAFAAVFGPSALAEVPLAATVAGQVVMGTADRLLITPKEITVVDYKTARRPPATLDAIPDGVLRQMAAYVAALEAIYPGRRVTAAVLYTQTPQLFALPPAVLAAYKGVFAGSQESLLPAPVE